MDSRLIISEDVSGIRYPGIWELIFPNASVTKLDGGKIQITFPTPYVPPATGEFENIVLDTGTITTSKPAISIVQDWNNAIELFTGISIEITNTNSDPFSTLISILVDGSPIFTMDIFGNVLLGTINGIGTANNIFNGRVISSAPTSAVADSDLFASSYAAHVDEGTNELVFRVKYSDGVTVKTGTVPLI